MHYIPLIIQSLLAGAILATSVDAGAPPFVFEDLGAYRGLKHYESQPGQGSGISAADYDGDGLVDFFLPTKRGVPDQLYRNVGSGLFREVAGEAGVDSTVGNRCALWFDYDGDKDLDLLVLNDDRSVSSTFLLYRQEDDHTFDDVTHDAGLAIPMPTPIEDSSSYRGGIAAGDLDNDGDLDFFATMWNGDSQLVFNDGDGTFREASPAAGVNSAVHFAFQPAILDFNDDGRRDIYVAIDFLWNALYISNGDETFVDRAKEAGLDNAMNDMGMALGDFDNDRDFDIYITNIFQQFAFNILLRNDSAGGSMAYQEMAEIVGVDYGGWGWGATFLDADNDGWLDIAATNGFTHHPHGTDKSVFYWSRDKAARFENVAAQVGFDDSYWGNGLIAADLDRDGDLDLAQTTSNSLVRLLFNTAGDFDHRRVDRHYLVVRPRMNGANHYSIGAVVRVKIGGLTMSRIITAGTSYLSQEPAEAFFGLGGSDTVDSIEIIWPDGSVSLRADVAGDRVLTLHHAGPGDLDADNDVDLADFREFIRCLDGPAGESTPHQRECRPADVDGTEAVDLADLALLLPLMGQP